MRSKYFTLLEILIAIGVLMFVIIVGYRLVDNGLKMREQNKRVVKQLQVEHNILALIAKDVMRCQWLNDKNTNIFRVDEDPQIPESSVLNLVCFFEKQDPDTDQRYWLNEVGYKLDFNIETNDYTLFRRSDKSFDKDITKGGDWAIVYEHLKGFKIQCLEKDEWIDSWDSAKAKTLPKAVDIQITLSRETADGPEDYTLSRKVLLTHALTFKRHAENVDTEGNIKTDSGILPGE